MRTVCAWVMMTALAGCSRTGLSDPTFPTGSSTLATSADARFVYTASADEGVLSALPTDGGAPIELHIGGEPVRVARAGERIFVSLRSERAVAIVEHGDEGLVETARIEVGPEPFGVVANEDGTRVWVAVSQANEVAVLDTASESVIERYPVDGEPRWLARHPGGSLYVGGVAPGSLFALDLDTGEVEPIELPVTRHDEVGVSERTPRVTGDLAVAPNGSRLAVPVLYIDAITPLGNPDGSTIVTTTPYYGGKRNEPAVVLYDLGSGGGVFDGSADPLTVRTQGEAFGSYPTSATFSPDGSHVLVTQEASDVLYVVRSTALPSASINGFVTADMGFVRTPRGPRGVVFSGDDEAWVHSFVDRRLTSVPFAQAVAALDDRDDVVADGPLAWSDASRFATLERLDPDIELGRDLFFNAVDTRMAGPGSGVSCSTCHFDGRTDGITWPFFDMPRQTPSLAGQVSATAPFTWADDVATVAEEATITSSSRMGGTGVFTSDAAAVAAFVDWTRPVDHADLGATSAQIELGRELFHDATVGCADCHAPQTAFTDGERHFILGSEVATRTPTLIGIAATAPYFSDGSAVTLREVVEYAQNGRMGNTADLDQSQIDALVAYLRTL